MEVRPALAVAGVLLTRPSKFTALLKADEQKAEGFALRQIGSGVHCAFYISQLIDLYAKTGRSADVVRLFDDYAGDEPLSGYPRQIALATALVDLNEFDRARPLLLELIMGHDFAAPLQLYRRLPPTLDSVSMAVAAFNRSTRSANARIAHTMHLVDIATAAGELGRAAFMMESLLEVVGSTRFAALPKAKATMKPSAGDAALVDLYDMLMPAIPFFLISGTLLGVIREGRLLGGDKDIDVGIMSGEHASAVRTKVAASRKFKEQFVPSVDLIKLTHRNGVKIDIFLHHREGDVIWHGSHLHAWDNRVWWKDGEKPLIEHEYAGRPFLIPSDPDMYLTDNYGDWRTPRPNYDASLEAPNRRVRVPQLTKLHWQKLIVRYYMDAELSLLAKAFRYYEEEFGVDAFLRKAGDLLILKPYSVDSAGGVGASAPERVIA
jgi:phosphorylcholine metabolism protein LicD